MDIYYLIRTFFLNTSITGKKLCLRFHAWSLLLIKNWSCRNMVLWSDVSTSPIFVIFSSMLFCVCSRFLRFCLVIPHWRWLPQWSWNAWHLINGTQLDSLAGSFINKQETLCWIHSFSYRIDFTALRSFY